MTEQKIRFQNLVTNLKVFVVLGWIVIAIDILAFLVGFILGLIEEL